MCFERDSTPYPQMPTFTETQNDLQNVKLKMVYPTISQNWRKIAKYKGFYYNTFKINSIFSSLKEPPSFSAFHLKGIGRYEPAECFPKKMIANHGIMLLEEELSFPNIGMFSQ